MKNKLKKFLIGLFIAIILFELTEFSFLLMNQPNTLFFYVGFSLIALELFIIGWYLLIFMKKDSPEEKNDEESK
jgi:hypothetical protein